jgi:hypothetical protein
MLRIAAIEIGAGGEVTARETVDTEASAEVISICCMAGDAGHLAALAHRCSGDQAAVARQLRTLARDLCIGISPHAVVVDRAFAAVDAVNAEFRRMQDSGGMCEINKRFQAWPAQRRRRYDASTSSSPARCPCSRRWQRSSSDRRPRRPSHCGKMAFIERRQIRMSKANRWTAADLDRLRSLLDAGKTAREIAVDLGRTPLSIYGQVQRLSRKRDPANDRREGGDPC